MKFGRTFTMTVQVADSLSTVGTNKGTATLFKKEAVTISDPLTVVFDINRNTLASANTARFTIYNLKESTRRKIFHDRYDTLTYRQIIFRAGYKDMNPLPVCFQGNIIVASSQRRHTEFITEIEAFDGGGAIINAQTSATFPAGTSRQDVIKALLQTMGKFNVSTGVIGDFQSDNSRGIVALGNTWDVTNKIAGAEGTAFVDNEKANVLKKNEYIANAGGILVLKAATGLLETPVRYNARIDVDILFEPRLVIGQIVQLESKETVNNGVYQVIGIRHNGVISGAVNGRCVTTVSLWQGTERLTGVSQ